MAVAARPAAAGAARSPSAASCCSASSSLFVLLPLYWMFNTSIKPSDDYLAIPPVWFPEQPTIVHYTAALFTYRGLDGLINSLIVSVSRHGPVGAPRHADGLQPRALQHRRPAPVLLGAVAALPAADRHHPAGLPDLPHPRHPRHPLRPDHRLHRLHPAGVGLDDVRLFPPDAELDGGGGPGRRLHPLAGVLARRRAARRARHRRGRRLRLHRLLDRVLLRPRADQPRRLHPADGVPRLHRLPGRAVRRGGRARDRLARSPRSSSACSRSATSCAG